MKKKPKNERVWDSMKSCAAAINISIDILRVLKQQGCPAFRGSRIYEVELRKCLKKVGDGIDGVKNSGSIRDKKVFEEWRRIKRGNDIEDRMFVKRDTVVAGYAAHWSRVDAMIEQKLCNEYPTAVAGLEPEQARLFGKRLGDTIRREWAGFLKGLKE